MFQHKGWVDISQQGFFKLIVIWVFLVADCDGWKSEWWWWMHQVSGTSSSQSSEKWQCSMKPVLEHLYLWHWLYRQFKVTEVIASGFFSCSVFIVWDEQNMFSTKVDDIILQIWSHIFWLCFYRGIVMHCGSLRWDETQSKGQTFNCAVATFSSLEIWKTILMQLDLFRSSWLYLESVQWLP